MNLVQTKLKTGITNIILEYILEYTEKI